MRRFLLAALLLLPLSSFAANVSVSPVIVRADTSERVLTMSFTNKGSTPSTYQISAERWTQDAQGKSIKTPTTELLFAPIIKVAPGAKRTVRLARQIPGPAQYVLTLQEILPPRKEGETGLRFPTNFRVPVLFEAQAGQVVLAATHTNHGLLLANTGDKAAHLTSIGVKGAKPWEVGHLGWVLPGGHLLLAYPKAQGAIELKVNNRSKEVVVR